MARGERDVAEDSKQLISNVINSHRRRLMSENVFAKDMEKVLLPMIPEILI